MPDDRLIALADRLQATCLARGLTVATAESCTGGLVGHALTSIPGASSYYLGGLITYADALKRDLAGVPAEVLETHGAVSAQVAIAMAEGVRDRIGADVAVSVLAVSQTGDGKNTRLL